MVVVVVLVVDVVVDAAVVVVNATVVEETTVVVGAIVAVVVVVVVTAPPAAAEDTSGRRSSPQTMTASARRRGRVHAPDNRRVVLAGRGPPRSSVCTTQSTSQPSQGCRECRAEVNGIEFRARSDGSSRFPIPEKGDQALEIHPVGLIFPRDRCPDAKPISIIRGYLALLFGMASNNAIPARSNDSSP